MQTLTADVEHHGVQPVGDDPSDNSKFASWHAQIAVSTTIIAVLACLSVVYFARAILLPIALALLLNLVFKPIVVRAERWKISTVWSSSVIMFGVLLVLAMGINVLWQPALDWIGDLPTIRKELAVKLRPLRRPVEKINEASKEVEEVTNLAEDSQPLRVRVEQPKITSFLVNTSGNALAALALTLALLYFLLAGGDRFLEKAVSIMPTWSSKKNVVELSRAIQRSISSYLLTITCINAGLGLVIGTAMWGLGLPTPALWGFMAFLLNYIPFAGAAAGAVIVFVIALMEYRLSYAVLAPLAYVLINIIEANFVTPSLLGRSMSLNPVVILISLAVWGWMWGIGGVLLAVPILIVFHIMCDHVDALAPLARFLER